MDECTPYGRTFDVPLVEGHGLRFRFWAIGGTHTPPPQEWVDEHLCAAVPDLLRQLEPALRELPRGPEGALADPCAAVPALTDLVGGGEANRQNRRDPHWWQTIDLCEAVGPLGKVAVRYEGDDRSPFAPDSTLLGRPVSVDHHGNERQNCSLVWYQRNRAEEGSEGLVTVAVGLLSDDNPPTRPFEADPCVEVAKAATAVMEELDR
ncbi:hypothetical protein Q5530_04810 [Saccharothrix sp. BKS2]|uniref:hypothetical protein n=1 Tax=Saccharothrix sp. BKS2 TaxID=3064400 RepID=UPI0039EA60C6